MKKNSICPKCNSDKIIPEVPVTDETKLGVRSASVPATLKVDEDPTSWFFKQYRSSELVAYACGDCGFVEYYISSPDQLWKAHQLALQRKQQKPSTL